MGDLSARLGVAALGAASIADVESALGERHVSPAQARYFANALDAGRVLLVLDEVEQPGAALSVLRAAGADLGDTAAGAAADGAHEVRVPLRSEVLDVATYLVHAGDVHVHKEIATEVQRFDIPLVREELVIERTDASGAAPAEVIRIPLTHQDVNVTRRTVVENEVVIRKRQYEEIRHIEEPVRREIATVTQRGDFVMRADEAP